MQKHVAIEIKNLYFAYKKEIVLENLNLEIKEGEYIAVIGPNGGGKSTFLKIIAGLVSPAKGQIRIFGKDIKSEIIGYLPQMTDFALDLPIRVIDVVLQGRLKQKKLFFCEKDYEISFATMKKIGIFELKDRKISELSGGQRQKVLLARALVSKPKILLLDEPTASIDVEGQEEIYTILKNLSLTKIVVSHDIRILFEGVERIAYINKKLFMHQNPELSLSLTKEHFCEIELFNYLKNNSKVI